jgi:ABC-type transporter Mla subunit MlaD
MAGFNPITGFMKEVREFMASVTTQLASVVEELREIRAELKTLNAKIDGVHGIAKSNSAKLDEIIHEVSRFTGKSDNLMISAFAYATHHCKAIHTGDIAKFGKMATQVSLVEGFSYEQMDDPRYGSVFVYEQEALNIAFEYFFIRKQTTYTGDN